jgi:tetratricopeptide (TPR) repeat protein
MEPDRHIPAEGLEPHEYAALVPIYEEALRADPEDLVALAYLGHAYTRTARFEEGLELDLRLTRLVPGDPVAQYNLGCSYALLGRTEEALFALGEAVRLGYREPDHMREDEDLAALRDLPRFHRLLERIERLIAGD